MTDIRGIKSGAVLQRNADNLCKVKLYGDFSGTPKVSHGTLTPNEDGSYTLGGILIGGPYEITVSDEQSAVTFTDIYVGDLWLLAGQSNMEGAGWTTNEDKQYAAMPSPLIRAYYMYDEWGAAKPGLHHQHRSPDAPHKKAWNDYIESLAQRNITVYDLPPNEMKRVVGPGLYFAKEMFALTGVPQGVIPAAIGGAPIEMWLPVSDGTENYYTAACRRLIETGSHIKGVFWAQGEGNPNADVYPSQIESIRADLCRRLNVPVMPWVQMQSFKCTVFLDRHSADVWTRFREMQRKMPENTTMLATVATNDLELDDCIHLSSDSQKKAGFRAARAMNYMLTGRGAPEMRLRCIRLEQDKYVPAFSDLRFCFDHVVGDLHACGVPSGIAYRKIGSDEEPGVKMLRRLLPEQNELVVRLEIPTEELQDYEFYYGYGNLFYCNITDDGGRAVPAMGPIALRDWLEK